MTDTSPLDLNTIQALGFELIHGLERPSVLGQLLISAIAIASAILVNQKLKPWLRKYDHWLAPLIPITISIMLLVIAGFFYRALGTKFGLINKAAELAALLWMINYSMILIKHFTQSNRVNFYKRRLVLPVFIAFSAFSLTDLISDRTQVFNADLFRLFGTNITIGDLILITFGLYWWIILSSLLTEFLQWSFGLGSTGNPQSNKGFYILIRYALIGLGSFVIIGYVGINPTVFGLITGGLSVGLGLGLKEVVSNFASGIWLLIEGALKPGDIINLSSIDQSKDPYEIGFISHLGLRAATIVSYSDNSERIVPNQTFFTNQIQTYTRSQNIIARKVWIGVSYGSNPIQVIELLEQLGSDHPRILNTPRPKAYFTTYGESSLNFCLKFWIKEISDGLTVSSEINCQIWELFQDKGIEIPFPQAVVHMVTPDQDPGI
jgi:small-conductance mechanosensitive channel